MFLYAIKVDKVLATSTILCLRYNFRDLRLLLRSLKESKTIPDNAKLVIALGL